ncbi:GNAT family N-acetyltransferase [Roseibium sp. SCPC15]|uniref:GNAT family N-acetyltransferase n=1 Tax=Roseibium sp. SCP15 TaxID=3141376 RepID=UPI00333AA5B3
MHVSLVETTEQLQALESAWCDVYRRDPESQFFLSWWWLTDFMSKTDDGWVVLIATPDGADAPVAFFPLRLKLKKRRKSGEFINGFNMAGNYAADYTGFLCLTEYEDEAIPAFAAHLNTMSWAFLKLEYVRTSKRRKELFLNEFPKKTFRIKPVERVNEIDNVNNLVCPYVDLPGTFEAYLTERLSSNSRQKLRRLLRKVDEDQGYRITHATAETIDRDIEILLDLWKAQWGERKGARLDKMVSNNRIVLRGGFDMGHLFMPMLWKGEQPVAVLGSFLDHEKKTVLFMIAGRDQSFNDIPSGLVLHAHSIRHVIDQGFETYDFLRGNERYKYSFGCDEVLIDCINITTRSGVNLGDRLAEQSIPAVFSQATLLHQQQRREEAETGYRQILATVPQHAGALYGLGQLLAAHEDHAGARQQYEALTRVQPGKARAWLRLAQVCQRLSDVDAACEAYRRVVELEPGLISARFGLAKCLSDLGRPSEAVEELYTILRLPALNEADRRIAAEATKFLSVLKPGTVSSHPLVRPDASADQSAAIILRKKASTCVSPKPPQK